MTDLRDAQAYRYCGVVGKATLPGAMQVPASLDGAVQGLADVDVVVEVAKAGAPDPAVRLTATRTKLVCWPQAHLGEFIVQAVLPREEARKRRLMAPCNGVVVACQDEAVSLLDRKLLKAIGQRSNESHLALDLDLAAVARGDIDADDGDLSWLGLEHHRRCPTRKRHGHSFGQVLSNRNSARKQYATLTRIVGMVHIEATCAEPFAEERGTCATARLREHNHVVSTRPQPAENLGCAWRCRRPDVEGQQADRGGGRLPCSPTGRASRSRDRALGLNECRHGMARPRTWRVVAVRALPAFDGPARFPARLRDP